MKTHNLMQECLNKTQTSRDFFTGAVTGVTTFAKSPWGIATFVAIMIILVGSIVVLISFRKKKIEKKK